MKDKKLLAIIIGCIAILLLCTLSCFGLSILALKSTPKYDLASKHTYGVIVPPFDQKTEEKSTKVSKKGSDLIIEPQYGRTLQLHIEKVNRDSVEFSVETYVLDNNGNTSRASCTDTTNFKIKKGDKVTLRTCYLGVTDTWELTLNKAK